MHTLPPLVRSCSIASVVIVAVREWNRDAVWVGSDVPHGQTVMRPGRTPRCSVVRFRVTAAASCSGPRVPVILTVDDLPGGRLGPGAADVVTGVEQASTRCRRVDSRSCSSSSRRGRRARGSARARAQADRSAGTERRVHMTVIRAWWSRSGTSIDRQWSASRRAARPHGERARSGLPGSSPSRSECRGARVGAGSKRRRGEDQLHGLAGGRFAAGVPDVVHRVEHSLPATRGTKSPVGERDAVAGEREREMSGRSSCRRSTPVAVPSARRMRIGSTCGTSSPAASRETLAVLRPAEQLPRSAARAASSRPRSCRGS